MDLAAMAFATVAINLERLLPRGERVARVAGIALLAAGMLALTNT
jgi:predicted metal-binding membrane protein